ncbi:MAG: S-layer homology domain-containing protein [Oscillospiraceae bacterium]|nr:S-layer homology domain-containing protein [Oscillospiraceae bacterium]
MKQWKFCLALILAAILLFGLAVTSHAEGELTFSDAGRITHKMPATVLSGLGIINGYPNNTFRPKSNITRAEFCKMLAVMDNGGKEPEGDYTSALTFTDTAASPLKNDVAYCVMMHYAAGRNAKTFDPEGNVTLLEAAKMLLCALGHDPEAEGFVGESWADNVRTEAYRDRSGLFREINQKTLKKLNGALSRDDACQMFYNTLTANVVYVDVGVSTSAGEISIQDEYQIKELPNEDFDYLNRQVDQKLQLIERVFPKIRATVDASDEFGRPCDTWVNGSQKIGPLVFRTPAIVCSANNLTGKIVMDAIKEDPTSLVYYQNGKLTETCDISTMQSLFGLGDIDCPRYVREHDYPFLLPLQSNTAAYMLALIWKNSTQTLGYGASPHGKVTGTANRICYYGIYTEIYYDSNTRALTICCSHINPARVNRVYPEQLDENGNVVVPSYVSATFLSGSVKQMRDLDLTDDITIPIKEEREALFLASLDENDSDYRQGEVVLLSFGYDVKTNKYTVLNVLRTVETSGYISGPFSYASSTSINISRFYMNGDTSESYYIIRKDDVFPLASFNIGDQYVVYSASLLTYFGTETSGYAFYLEPLKLDNVNKIAYVARAGVETDIFGEKTYRAKLINSEGSQIDVVTDTYCGNMVDCLVSYTTDAHSKYSLTKVGSSGLGSFTVKQGNAKMTLTPAKSTAISIRGPQDLDYANERSILANDNTLFIIGSRPDENEDLVYETYVGIKNVPDTESATYYNYVEKDGIATVVFIYENTSNTSNSSYGLLFKTDKDVFKTYVTGSTGYYEMEAVIDDEAKTVQVTPALYTSLKYGINLFSGCSANADGWLTAVKLLDSKYVYPITALESADKGVLHLNFDENGDGGERLIVHDGIHVYAYSLRNQKLSVITADELSDLGDVAAADELFGANAPFVKKGYYTLHETYEGKPLAGIFVIVN